LEEEFLPFFDIKKKMKTAVVGGGISSLVSAYYLARKSIPVTLIYKGHLGGWIHSFKKNDVLYETGPRSLRPSGDAGFATLELISDLNLQDELVSVGSESAAARNRFIYFDGKLHNAPSSIKELLASKSPVLKGLVASVLKEPFQPKSTETDESIAAFVNRRLGKHVTDNLVSAIVHGIYAGDVAQLSVRSTFKMLWELEQRGGLVKGAFHSAFDSPKIAYKAESEKAQSLIDIVSKSKMYSFKNGMQTLVDGLVKELKKMNVNMIQSECTSLDITKEHALLGLENGERLEADHVISGIPAWNLYSILSSTSKNDTLQSLSKIQGVDVGVVNLVYQGYVLPHQGFGFLVPKSQVDQCNVIGVVYDSCVFPEQDQKPVTRLTAMMGGYLFAKKFGNPKTVSKKVLEDVAVKEVERILGIPSSLLLDTHVSVQEQCIPQYTVGHEDTITSIESQCKSLGRLSLVGSSFRGVSVNDCVFNAKKVIQNIN
jgi:oxygen-dependent protoporphyrinogen oxidase